MAGHGLSESITVGLTGHPAMHSAIHDIIDKFDKDDAQATGHVWIYSSTDGVFRSRAFLSTDNPGVVTNSQAASYTLVLTDAGQLVEITSGSSNNLTVPPNSSVAFPVGTVIGVRQYGAGTTTIVPGAGVTIRSRGGLLNMAGTYAEASLTKRATDEWVLSGDVA